MVLQVSIVGEQITLFLPTSKVAKEEHTPHYSGDLDEGLRQISDEPTGFSSDKNQRGLVFEQVPSKEKVSSSCIVQPTFSLAFNSSTTPSTKDPSDSSRIVIKVLPIRTSASSTSIDHTTMRVDYSLSTVQARSLGARVSDISTLVPIARGLDSTKVLVNPTQTLRNDFWEKRGTVS